MRGSRGIAGTWLCLLLGLCALGQSPQEDQFRSLLEHGFALHQQANYMEAIPVLEKARQLQPNDYFANLLLGMDFLRTGRAAAAISYLQVAARARPEEDTPEEYLGEAHASLGNFALAASAYLEAVRRGKDSEQALTTWAGFALERFRQIGEELRSSEEGVRTSRRLQAEASTPLKSLTCSAPIPFLEKKLADSRTTPNSGMETRHDLSLCYAIEADRAATRLNANVQDPAALHQLRGDVLLRLRNDYPDAVAEYKKAITIRANDPALYERLAEAQMSAGDAAAARQSAMAALAIDPRRNGAMGTLALLAMNNRDYEEAVPWLRKMKAESPRDRNVQVELGKALAQTGEPADALANLSEALAAGYPDDKGALHSLEARLLRELGRNAEASKAAEEARRLSNSFQSRKPAETGNANADQ